MFDPSKAIKKMLGPGVKTPKFGKPNSADLDGDGISNIMDCQPKNMFRQDKLTFNNTQISLVQEVDNWAQENDEPTAKKFERIFNFASPKNSQYGWEGIAKNEPEIFKQALEIAYQIGEDNQNKAIGTWYNRRT